MRSARGCLVQLSASPALHFSTPGDWMAAPVRRICSTRNSLLRSFAIDRSASTDGEKGGNRFDQACAERNDAVSHHHGFHVVRGGFLPDAGNQAITNP